MDVAQGTIVVWSDIACPWATLAIHRLHGERTRLDLDDRVVLDHRTFPLELVNGRCTPRRVLAAEVPVAGALAPEFGWQMWQAPEAEWPVTTLPALEAVQAAKEQSLEASEALDLALRRALFAESRCISMRHVVLDVAASVSEVDCDALTKALDNGDARHAVVSQWHDAVDGAVRGSPHLFLCDGSDAANPGITMHWEGEHGEGFPVIDADDPVGLQTPPGAFGRVVRSHRDSRGVSHHLWSGLVRARPATAFRSAATVLHRRHRVHGPGARSTRRP